MKNIKKFGKGWAVFILIGVGVGIFVAHMGPILGLDRFAIMAIAVVSGIILASLYWIFVKSRKKKDEKMKTDSIYEEKIFSKWITVIMAVVTLGFLFLFVYQILVGPIGDRPAPNWGYLVGFLLFLGITINFSILSIKITPQSIVVGYGIFKDTILWENIKDCYLDKASAIRYGGWGIRMGRVKGKWRSVYNTIGEPRVVLSLKKGRFFREFVFSTKNPDKVMKIIKQKVETL